VKRSDGFIGNDFHWFIGEVEDIDDTELYNRVKVRAYGYYEEEKNGGPSTDDLPWATVMMPTTSASNYNRGSTHGLEVRSWVVGFFRDGSSAQDPIILGSIQSRFMSNTLPDSPAGHKNKIPTGEKTLFDSVTASPLGSLADLVGIGNPDVGTGFDDRPSIHNKIHVTSSTDRLVFKHASGSYIVMDREGNILIKSASGGKTKIT